MEEGAGSVERVFMTYTVERQLTDFFSAEVEFHLRAEALKRALLERSDWNLHVAFQTVDTTRDGHLNYKNIQSFLRFQGQLASDEHVIAIVRRLDADADQCIRLQEFIEMLTPSDMPVVNNNFSLPTVIERNQRNARDSPFQINQVPVGSNSPLRTKMDTATKSVRFAD
jgi:hypothetical protein